MRGDEPRYHQPDTAGRERREEHRGFEYQLTARRQGALTIVRAVLYYPSLVGSGPSGAFHL